jgi:5-methyltetrahydrofolate--homocysteine methyltransferase
MGFNDAFDAVIQGRKEQVESAVEEALAAAVRADQILYEALIPAIAEVGRPFETGEYFVPEMLVAARAMQAGLSVLRPRLLNLGARPVGTVALGTVKGDLHDIGKNLLIRTYETNHGRPSELGE